MIVTHWQDSLLHAWGGPVGSASFKLQPEDFRVDEVLGFEPDGEGEHIFWRIEKRGISTPRLIDHLAQRLRMSRRDISWAGLKDRQSVSTQWVSLRTGLGRELDTGLVESAHVKVLESRRNSRKLRTGSHKGNRFRIRLLNTQVDHGALQERLQLISREGVPNYFGSQRFGREGGNLDNAARMFRGDFKPASRAERGLLLSAVRSYAFNQLLSSRIADGCWNRLVQGDVFALEGSRSVFRPEWETIDASGTGELEQRLLRADIHPTGPLPGRGMIPVTGNARQYEEISGLPPELFDGLLAAGLEHDRRALRLMVHDLVTEPADEGGVVVEFRLGRGGYATSVLRELVDTATTAATGETTE